MLLDTTTISLLDEAVRSLDQGFSSLPPVDPRVDVGALRACLTEVAARMRDNYPYPHPYYIGQMLKPPHPMARLAYALSLWINPNNHALDGGHASSALEKEAVAQIAHMFGWEAHLGHLTGGGTMANLEALWIAEQTNPGRTIVASDQAHYTHRRLTGVLKIPFREVACDSRGRMDVSSLEEILKTGEVGTVVVTMGTTATGSIDPLPAILELRKTFEFRIHLDAAYGGYFRLIDGLDPEARAAFDRMSEADSIVVDPHKHGLQPYGCGCVLFSDPSLGRFYRHDSPYTYFTSSELHLGEISLECSRPGAAAVALWATQRLLPLLPGGSFACDLAQGRRAALSWVKRLVADGRYVVPFPPQLDIVVWAPRSRTVSESSRLSETLFREAAGQGIHLAKARLPRILFSEVWPEATWDEDHVTCLRACLMKPEHLDWIERIWTTYHSVADRVLPARV